MDGWMDGWMDHLSLKTTTRPISLNTLSRYPISVKSPSY